MKRNFFTHQDKLGFLQRDIPLREKLRRIHNIIRGSLPFIDRIAVALHDNKSDLLKTYISSNTDESPLVYYDAPLSGSKSLQEIVSRMQPRVINDLSVFDQNMELHAQKIKATGFRASYTLPIVHRERFLGFLFYNSYQKNCLSDDVLEVLDLYGHLIINILVKELSAISMLINSLRSAVRFVKEKDPETGMHLERMARYSRLIAQGLAKSGRYSFTDEEIECIFLFAPLHDLGKIAIPDKILLKPAKLDASEWTVMKTHSIRGFELVNSIIDAFDYNAFEHIDISRNIPRYHHETVDGTGYPTGASREEIPIEARIIAVADIFDALTSERPYKSAWKNEEAFLELRKLAGSKVDADCVCQLISQEKKIKDIQMQFSD